MTYQWPPEGDNLDGLAISEQLRNKLRNKGYITIVSLEGVDFEQIVGIGPVGSKAIRRALQNINHGPVTEVAILCTAGQPAPWAISLRHKSGRQQIVKLSDEDFARALGGVTVCPQDSWTRPAKEKP